MTPPPAAAAAPAVQPRRPAAPRGPRRVSGPSRRPTPAQPQRSRGAEGDAGLIFGLIASLEGLAQHRLIDRLIRGRIWIGLVAFALIGIVTLQLGLLRLNGGIGRALEHEAMLQRENAALSIENSELAAGERIESRAARLGMVNVPLGALSFLAAHPHSDATKAAAALSSSARVSTEGGEETSSASTASESSEAQSESSESSESQSSAESSTTGVSSASESTSEAEESPSASAESSAPATTESSSNSASEATPAGGTQAGSQGE
jgi:hypothetical protein